MNSLRFLLIISCMAAWVPIGVAQGQEEPPGKSRFRDVDLETRVYQLINVDLHDAHSAVTRLYNARNVAAIENTNSLVVRDVSDVLDQISMLFEQMEQQSRVDKPSRETAQVIRLTQRDPDYIASILDDMFHSTNIRADFDSRQIVLKGDDAEEIQDIARMIKALDVQADYAPKRARGRTISVTVNFISATVGAAGSGDLPEKLKGVGAALRQQGLGDLSVYGHLMVRTQEGHTFESNGVVRSEQESAVTFIRIRGTAKLADGQAELEIESKLDVPITQTRRDREGKTHTATSYEDFGLSTTTTVPLGDYLVLGAMPASTDESDTILMVIHITAD